jgi:hypothetical protein
MTTMRECSVPFVVPGPVIDADVASPGAWAVLCASPSGPELITPQGRFPSPVRHARAFVRVLATADVLVVAPWCQGTEAGAAVVSPTGERRTTFDVGRGVQDVVVTGDRIVCSYFDEGIFSADPLSREGLCVFDVAGRRVLGYHADVEGAVRVDDCYCLGAGASDEVWFSAYQSFNLVRLNVRTGAQAIRDLPAELHGCRALAVSGTEVYLYGPYANPTAVYRLTDGAPPARCGTIPGVVRGLGAGAFLAVGPRGYCIIAPSSA